jgi:hypothetical protein
MKRRNKINGQWSPRLIEMLESPAYRVLTTAAHRVISRIEIELGHHGGNDNGRLPVTYNDFIDYGVARMCVAPAIREAEALGFIRVKRGRGGNANNGTPNLFGLTFSYDRGSRASPPTQDWRKIKTVEDAMRIAQDARQNKDEWAVKYADLRKQKNRKPVLKTSTGTDTKNQHRKRQIPSTETSTTGAVRKPAPLSISWVGDPASTAAPDIANRMSASATFEPAQDRADLLAYYLFAMKYGEHMQQPDREAA